MHPDLVLASHSNVYLFINGLKTNIPGRVEKLKYEMKLIALVIL